MKKNNTLLAILASLMIFSSLNLAFARAPKKAKPPVSFNAAKRLMPKIYAGHEKTFYCGCSYQKKDIQEAGCDYKNRGEYKLSWEHLTPASALGGHRKEWREGHVKCVKTSQRKRGQKYKGRKCLERVNKKYRAILGNPYNLYPAILRLNIKRQNYPFTDVKPTASDLVGSKSKSCHLQVNNKTAYAGAEIQGEIARNYLYLQATYPEIPLLTKHQTKQMYQWSAQDTPDEWECERAKRIREETGLINQFTEVYCERSITSN